MLRFCLCLFVFVGMATADIAHALEPLALYDDFKGDRINAALWDGGRRPDSSVLDFRREVRGGGLRLANRTYGQMAPTGTQFTAVRLSLPDGEAVTRMAAKLAVKSVDLGECELLAGLGDIRFRILGFYFNTGVSEPTPGDPTDDILADIRIWREADSAERNGIMRVKAGVFQCGDPSCSLSGGHWLFEDDTSLGRVRPNQKVRIGIDWDPTTETFVFTRNGFRSVYSYAGTGIANNHPPGIIDKRLEVVGNIANCPTDPQPSGAMEVRVDRFWVNASAANP